MKTNPQDLRTYSVQTKPCKSCPFAGSDPVKLTPKAMQRYLEKLASLQSQHFCHSTSDKICRGGRDIQLKLLCAIGMLEAPTDEAFDREVSLIVDLKLV